jgi:hypothetical protein
MRANYLKGAIGLSKHKMGIGLVDKNIFNERLEICKYCEHIKNYNIELERTKCGICGCYIRPKLSLKTEKCPLNQW